MAAVVGLVRSLETSLKEQIDPNTAAGSDIFFRVDFKGPNLIPANGGDQVADTGNSPAADPSE